MGLCPAHTDRNEWLTCPMGKSVGLQGCGSCGAKDRTVTEASG